MIIAIDGPAASGKSSTAKELAKRLNFLYLDSGAMYRAATYSILKDKIDLDDRKAIINHIRQLEIDQKMENNQTRTYLNGTDISEQIRGRDVTLHINTIASIQEIREILVAQQQFIGREGNIVVDGRDIGTVVFPDAELKIFMVADLDERAKRRFMEFQEKGTGISLQQVKSELKARDLQDEMREFGRLKKADDAIILDTSKLKPKEQVNFIIRQLKQKSEIK
ncbi:MAG: (d)CMP kinase [Calditrichaeota bacterium]|nr:(d)CMP kinase [Calditrichota bacterium]